MGLSEGSMQPGMFHVGIGRFYVAIGSFPAAKIVPYRYWNVPCR
jgi:hypothetical protein